jgi:hypothetical protein
MPRARSQSRSGPCPARFGFVLPKFEISLYGMWLIAMKVSMAAFERQQSVSPGENFGSGDLGASIVTAGFRVVLEKDVRVVLEKDEGRTVERQNKRVQTMV